MMRVCAGATGPGRSAIRDRVKHLSAQIKELSSSVHELSRQLHPSKLEQLGLAAAARSLCEELSRQHQIRIEFIQDEVPGSIPSDIALCLYRIVQEALQNVVKHSGAKEAGVELSAGPDAVCLRISDSGAGFEHPSARGGEGLGFVSMRERVRLVGGDLSVQSEPSRGTRIEVRVPLR